MCVGGLFFNNDCCKKHHSCKSCLVEYTNDGRFAIVAMPEEGSSYCLQVVFAKDYIRIDWSDGDQINYYPS